MDLVLLIGQSNAKGCGNPEESVRPGEHAWEYVENFTGNALIPMGYTLQLSEGRGTIAPAFANRYYEGMQEEVCVIHCAVDGSRIKNWLHDTNRYLETAQEKFLHAQEYIEKKYPIGRRFAIWIQGESDGKYGTDPVYYKEKLIEIGRSLEEKCGIREVFVSRTGHWLPDEENLARIRRIGAAQERACEEEKNLILVSKMASGFPKKGYLQDNVHYNMEALNLLGSEIAENIGIYYNEGRMPVLEETDDMEQARKFLMMLEEAEQ